MHPMSTHDEHSPYISSASPSPEGDPDNATDSVPAGLNDESHDDTLQGSPVTSQTASTSDELRTVTDSPQDDAGQPESTPRHSQQLFEELQLLTQTSRARATPGEGPHHPSFNDILLLCAALLTPSPLLSYPFPLPRPLPIMESPPRPPSPTTEATPNAERLPGAVGASESERGNDSDEDKDDDLDVGGRWPGHSSDGRLLLVERPRVVYIHVAGSTEELVSDSRIGGGDANRPDSE